jgi:hypothetical protein
MSMYAKRAKISKPDLKPPQQEQWWRQ